MRLTALLNIRHAPRDFTVYHSGLGKYTTDYSNLPQRFIKKKITKVEWKSPNHPRYTARCRSFVPRVHTFDRPWTEQYWSKNGMRGSLMESNRVRMPVVEPIREQDWMWFRGDRVEILTGPDKGKQGYINGIVQVTTFCVRPAPPVILGLLGEKLGDSGGFECGVRDHGRN